MTIDRESILFQSARRAKYVALQSIKNTAGITFYNETDKMYRENYSILNEAFTDNKNNRSFLGYILHHIEKIRAGAEKFGDAKTFVLEKSNSNEKLLSLYEKLGEEQLCQIISLYINHEHTNPKYFIKIDGFKVNADYYNKDKRNIQISLYIIKTEIFDVLNNSAKNKMESFANIICDCKPFIEQIIQYTTYVHAREVLGRYIIPNCTDQLVDIQSNTFINKFTLYKYIACFIEYYNFGIFYHFNKSLVIDQIFDNATDELVISYKIIINNERIDDSMKKEKDFEFPIKMKSINLEGDEKSNKQLEKHFKEVIEIFSKNNKDFNLFSFVSRHIRSFDKYEYVKSNDFKVKVFGIPACEASEKLFDLYNELGAEKLCQLISSYINDIELKSNSDFFVKVNDFVVLNSIEDRRRTGQIFLIFVDKKNPKFENSLQLRQNFGSYLSEEQIFINSILLDVANDSTETRFHKFDAYTVEFVDIMKYTSVDKYQLYRYISEIITMNNAARFAQFHKKLVIDHIFVNPINQLGIHYRILPTNDQDEEINEMINKLSLDYNIKRLKLNFTQKGLDILYNIYNSKDPFNALMNADPKFANSMSSITAELADIDINIIDETLKKIKKGEQYFNEDITFSVNVKSETKSTNEESNCQMLFNVKKKYESLLKVNNNYSSPFILYTMVQDVVNKKLQKRYEGTDIYVIIKDISSTEENTFKITYRLVDMDSTCANNDTSCNTEVSSKSDSKFSDEFWERMTGDIIKNDNLEEV